MFVSARQAYDQGTKTSGSGRQLEAGALFRAARRLEECQQTWNLPGHRERLRDALAHNQRLWTFFQTELTGPEHEMPVDLRRDLLRLSLFIDRRTLETLAEPTLEKLTALIAINRHIAAGLSSDPQAAGAGNGGAENAGAGSAGAVDHARSTSSSSF